MGLKLLHDIILHYDMRRNVCHVLFTDQYIYRELVSYIIIVIVKEKLLFRHNNIIRFEFIYFTI